MNILFILSDDQGFWSMGCAGSKSVKTPNLDRIAAGGILFENFFCASPVCSPARASIFTGTMPSLHGIQDWLAKGHVDESQLDDDLLAHFHSKDPLPWAYQWPASMLKGDEKIDFLSEFKCFTSFLADSGYECGITGKWHMGNAGTPQQGFTYWRTLAMGGENYMFPVVLNRETGKFTLLKNSYVTDWITDGAIEFLEQRDESKPFCLSVHYNAPHAPWDENHHPKELFELYDDCDFSDFPDEPMHEWANNQFETDEARRKQFFAWRKGYSAALSGMDKGIGTILDYLEAHDLMSDTMIIFTADNGFSLGHHGFMGKGNGTYPMNMWEPSVKVPTIISMPGGKLDQRPSSRTDDLFSHYDIMPTLLELCGIENPNAEKLPGKSFAPMLKGEDYQSRDDVVIMSEYGQARMIRTKEWKYIHRYPYGLNELFNIKNDPEERINLAENAEYENLVAELKFRMETWFSKYTSPERDARLEAVQGSGQIRKVGAESKGKKAFIPR